MLHRITLETAEGRRLPGDEATSRALVRTLSRVSAGRLLLFRVFEDRVDAVVRDDRPGFLASALRQALAARVGDGAFGVPHARPVESRSYLLWFVKHAVKPPHGGAGGPATLWTSSCFPELLGFRLLPGYDIGLVRAELPRLRSREVLVNAGFPPFAVEPATNDDLARAGVARLVELAASVFAIGPDLEGRSSLAVRARTVVVHAGLRAGFPPVELARFLHIDERSVRRLAARRGEARADLCLRRRLRFEECAVLRLLRAC